MAYAVANVNIATDTFNGWVTKTNLTLHQLTNYIVTANNEANGSLTTGNGFVIGILGSNTICVPSQLRGGNVQSTNTLNITSNVVVGNTFTINSLANFAYFNTNTSIQAANVYVNATNITLYSNTLSVPSNTVNFNSNTITVDNANINSNLIIRTDCSLIVYSNNDIGSNISTPVDVFSFSKGSFSTGKLSVQSKFGTNTNISEILVAHDTTTNTAQLTVYGSIKAPTTANLGVYSISTNATHVVLGFTQTNPNTSVKVVANLIK
jgi:hypothetical protein